MWWNLAFCVLILCFVPFWGQNVEARAYLGIFRRSWNYDSCFDMLSFVPGLLQGSPLRSARKCLQTSLFTFKVCLETLRFEFPVLLLEIFARQAVAWQLLPQSGKAGNLILCFGTVFGTKRRGASLSCYLVERTWNQTWRDETWLSMSWSCALYRFWDKT